jgi:hypothetical protein
MSVHDEDTNPGLTRTTTQRLVSIVQLAVDDVEHALGGPLTEAARRCLVHHVGRALDIGREHERAVTVEERARREELERKIQILETRVSTLRARLRRQRGAKG